MTSCDIINYGKVQGKNKADKHKNQKKYIHIVTRFLHKGPPNKKSCSEGIFVSDLALLVDLSSVSGRSTIFLLHHRRSPRWPHSQSYV